MSYLVEVWTDDNPSTHIFVAKPLKKFLYVFIYNLF